MTRASRLDRVRVTVKGGRRNFSQTFSCRGATSSAARCGLVAPSRGARPQIAAYPPPAAPKLAQASKVIVLTHLPDDAHPGPVGCALASAQRGDRGPSSSVGGVPALPDLGLTSGVYLSLRTVTLSVGHRVSGSVPWCACGARQGGTDCDVFLKQPLRAQQGGAVLGWASATVRALWGRALATGAIATAQPEGERHGSVVIRVLDHLFVRRGGV